MIVDIDKSAGFCFGVQKAILKVEEILDKTEKLYCLGEIVHNKEEVGRLENRGMKTITSHDLDKLQNATVLIRSHGEPPSTYQNIKNNNNTIIDATCPVVLKLQQRIKKAFKTMQSSDVQIVIFGKKDHPETIGLNGQTNNKAIIVTEMNDLDQIDFSLPIELFCQTTMPVDGFQSISSEIKKRSTINSSIIIHNTICRQVSGRVDKVKTFAQQHDLVIFVSGKKSSNGKFLFSQCKQANTNAKFISSVNEIENTWFNNVEHIGITGATSTPQWLLLAVQQHILNL